MCVSVCKDKKKLEKMKGGEGRNWGKGGIGELLGFLFSLRRVKNCKATRVEW